MARLFIATPLHTSAVHDEFAVGLAEAWAAGAGHWSRCKGTSLAHQRAVLVAKFAKSDFTHLLFVDSDIGFRGGDIQRLLNTGKDFIGGTYCRKSPAKPLTANLLDNWEGDLVEVTHVGTGFLLISRPAIERMLDVYADEVYSGDGLVALFAQNLDERTEDVSFCRRWRALGGQAWMHTGVVLPHYEGSTAYVADVSAIRPAAAAE